MLGKIKVVVVFFPDLEHETEDRRSIKINIEDLVTLQSQYFCSDNLEEG